MEDWSQDTEHVFGHPILQILQDTVIETVGFTRKNIRKRFQNKQHEACFVFLYSIVYV